MSNNNLKLTILGCGASGGVPAIGNNWGKCDPTEPKNNRSRASIAIEYNGSTLIVDTGPDFRQQLNREDIQKIDAVIYTHAHGDHIAGIDELRSFHRRYKERIPAFGNESAMREIMERFSYMFENRGNGLYPSVIEPTVLEQNDYNREYKIAGVPFIPFEQDHGTCTSLGLRFGDIAYSTDMVKLDDAAMNVVKGVKTWIVDGAGYHFDDNMVHASINDVIRMNEEIGAEEIYLTHMTLLMDYQTLCKELPEGMYPCYDGLTFKTKI